MSGLYEWIRSMVLYLILMTVILNLLPDRKYEKYLRMFAGTVFILLVFGPFSDLTGLEARVAEAFGRITLQNDARLLREELADADGDRLARLLSGYRGVVETDIAGMAESFGLRCSRIKAVLDEDTESTDFGALTAVEITVATDSGMGVGSEDWQAANEERLADNEERQTGSEEQQAGSEERQTGNEEQRTDNEERRAKRLEKNREIARLRSRIGEYYGLEEGKIEIRLAVE